MKEDGPALANITRDGIHDRAMLFVAEPSNFTKGLEIELIELRSKSRDDLRGTALGELVYGDVAPAQALENWQLLEPIQLNPEQRHAIRLALTRSLTVVSGPPGTGKSQLVASLILNASKRGQRVLFSSKNHKAVDVVQERVNKLTKLPAVLRLGDADQNAALLQNLTSFQTNGAGRDSQRKLEVAETDYASCSSDFDGLEREIDEIVRLRNEVDKQEQGVVRLRESLGDEWFHRLRHVDGGVLERSIHRLRQAIRQAKPNSLPKRARCLWWAFRGHRDRALASTFGKTKKMTTGFLTHTEMVNMNTAEKLLATLDQRFLDIRRIQGYSQLLDQLLACRRVEDVTGGLQQNREVAHEQAANLWKLWMECAPDRVAGPLKQHLANFINNLQTMVNAQQQQRGVPPAILEAFQDNLRQVLAVLPAWAVTSLSAHKRIPLQTGMFDLVVIDEASQCDIAAMLPLLYRSKRAVIIGDSRQLRHISGISPPLDGILRSRFDLARDAAWSFPLASAFDLAASRQCACRVDLKEHHRSHPDIIGVANELFYEGSLRVATRVDRLMVTNGKYPAVQWMEIDGSMEKTRDGWENQAEAEKVVWALNQLLLQSGYEGSIGVITPFRGQKNRIDRLITKHPRAGEMRARNLLVDTVHKFQGDERDIIVFSPALSQNAP
ncbi:MAG: AAA domain-containing protein, partial [Verrucomicrobia bacterium]|nr:AAA domain-containing protein [Verrucomicrobiota bacterium]